VAERRSTLPRDPRRLALLLDLGTNQAAWWWCILSARAGKPTFALLGPLAYAAGHVLLRPRQRSRVLSLAIAGGLVGLVGDTLLAGSELLSFPPGLTLGPVAPFMVSLWVLFAISLTASTTFLVAQPPWRAALLGALLGPLAYASGERLSVLELSGYAPVAIAAEWTLAVLVLTLLARLDPERVPA
jgi:hypothetical protein